MPIMPPPQGAADPLFYEFGAELTYPSSEAVSGAILVLIWNATSLVIIALPPSLGIGMNWVRAASFARSCVVRSCGVRVAVLRS